jgi:nucleoid DNA-binding protein
MVPFRCHKQRLDMTKTELQVALAAATETNKSTAGVFLDTLSALAYKEIKKNGEFVLPGFGKLVKQKRKARTGCNPKTIISIVESCIRLNIPIRDYLGSVLPGLANRPISQIAQFTLAAWANRNAWAMPPTSAAV